MTSLDSVTKTLEQIGRVQKSLLDLCDELASSNPSLLKVLSEGPVDMLRQLNRDLEEQLGLEVLPELEAPEADLWVRLEGPAIHDHVAPISVLVSILDAFRKGVTTVAEVLQHGRLSTRPTAAVKRATDLNVMALAPGSLQLALAVPQPPRQGDIFEELDEDLGPKAVRTLLEVAAWAGSPGNEIEIERLVPDPAHRRIYLTALQRVIPRPRGTLSFVEFRGRLAPGKAAPTIRLRKEAYFKVEEAIDRAVQEQLVTYHGILRGIDLDHASVRIRFIDEISEVRGVFQPDLLQSAIDALDRPVRVTGILRAEEGLRGAPRLEIIHLEIVDDEHEAEQAGPG